MTDGAGDAAALTHVDARGRAHMVDVGDKDRTRRSAVAEAVLRLDASTVSALRGDDLAKGDALAVARVAGIMAAKRTPDLVPLCHHVALSAVAVEIALDDEPPRATVTTTVRAADRTGVEMEAMVAASVAALTLYDMVKSIDRGAVIERVRLLAKRGGVRGDFERGDG